ncbi:hypothetical protein Pla123a_25600 [Posidoniimonas polymericola]|uniref:Methyltransferase domain-containing protein n=1 Tax=Posidoniimonas polymericola TaxID=2528002 RepID=A0A5C5YQK5_9BACT|nr:class I SAM-dependent methyltransferase [Posidoniimonas polymericola]TWT77129.1 hypothetical protein Pla123a_25600 [Posidoniimonas polymericola]
MLDVEQVTLIDTFFREDVARLTGGLHSLSERVDTEAVARRDEAYEQLLSLLSDSREACRLLEQRLAGDEPALREVQQRFQEAIEPWFSQSWMMDRARTKPQGYAGDYAMLTSIYEAEPKSKGIGGLLDLFFLATELGRAVPARKDAVREFLAGEFEERSGDVRVLNVACGPCREFEDGVACPPQSNVSVTFVDYDEDSLAFAEQQLTQNPGPFEYSFVRYNALRMQAPKRFIEEHGLFDVIYSVGLCDYLSDRQLIAMFKGWKSMLRPGGVLYVAFKDRHRYDKTDYQWLTDWFFLEREEADCRRLFVEAGYSDADLGMSRDASGIILNFAARDSARRRIDSPHSVGPATAAVEDRTPNPEASR